MGLKYADVNKYDDDYRLRLVCLGTWRDLEKYKIELKAGLHLVFYHDDADYEGNRDDLVFEGVIEYNDSANEWAAKIDWDAMKNMSQLSDSERQLMGIDS